MGKQIADFTAKLNKATSSRGPDGVPNVTVMAADGNGNVFQKIESGFYHPNDQNPKKSLAGDTREKFTADTVCWIASCTKLMTTVSVMQCVERGILNLDDDVGQTWLPEFKGPEILLRMEQDNTGKVRPILKKATRKVTLRNLLTHTSGLAYEFTHPKLNAWREWALSETKDGRSNARSSNIAVAHKVPLLFEPDEGWVYGYGIDWAGLAVMRATKQTLEEYMLHNIWKPCGMTSTTFSLADHRPDLLIRFAGMTMRDDDGNLIDLDRDLFTARSERVKYGGGGGCFSTANDYIKFLSSLLHSMVTPSRSSSLPSLLRESTLKSMFAQRLTPTATAVLNRTIAMPLAAGLAGNIPSGTSTTYSLGGIMNLDIMSNTGRSTGGMQWSGLPNLFWWLSPADGICGCYFTQILPPGDRMSLSLYSDFEAAVLKEWREGGKGRL